MWYAAKCKTSCHVDNKPPDDVDHTDTVIILVNASNRNEAFDKATHFAKKSETQYENYLGDMVSWIFDEVVEVWEVCETEPYDGLMVYSKTHKRSDDLW